MSRVIEIYDVTLRDGAQGPGIKFSPDDQLRIVRALDIFGVAYIEGGQPASNPKAADFFARAKSVPLTTAKIAAFGSTTHPKKNVEDDANIKALLEAGTEVVTIFAKASPRHVTKVLRTTLDRNLEIMLQHVRETAQQGARLVVFPDCALTGYCFDSLD